MPACAVTHFCVAPSTHHTHAVLRTPSTQVARALLAAGADPDLPDKASGQTPLHYAASNGHMTIMEELLSECQPGASVNTCMCAARLDARFLQHTVAMQCSPFPSMSSSWCSTILCSSHTLRMSVRLLRVTAAAEAGASYQMVDSYGSLPIQVSSAGGALPAVQDAHCQQCKARIASSRFQR